MGEQLVALADVREGVRGDGSDLEPTLERPLVERLDVAEHVLELESARVDPALGESPEHERVVGIGAVAQADQHGARG